MRLPTPLRKRLSCHGMTYGLQLITATTGVLLSTAVMAASATQHFAIAAGPLDKALSQFAARANVILSFSPQQTARLNSPGLQGDYSVDQGFALLLQNSGLQAVAQAPGSYVLQAAPAGQLTLAPTTVSAYQQGGFNQEIGGDVGYKAQNSRIGTKTSTPLSETPRSVSVVTGQRIKDQKSQTLTEVLGYVPGIFAPPFAATACCEMACEFKAIDTTPPANPTAWNGSRFSAALLPCSMAKTHPAAWLTW
jgi:iron complex outermembrane receptor protein